MMQKIFFAFLLLLVTGSSISAQTAYARETTSGIIYTFDLTDPSGFTEKFEISGIGPDQTVLAMDFNPFNGQLYTIAGKLIESSPNFPLINAVQLYQVNSTSGVAVAIGDLHPIDTSCYWVGFDFNPAEGKFALAYRPSSLPEDFHILSIDPSNGLLGTPTLKTHSASRSYQIILDILHTNQYFGANGTEISVAEMNIEGVPSGKQFYSDLQGTNIDLVREWSQGDSDTSTTYDGYHNFSSSNTTFYALGQLNLSDTVTSLYQVDFSTGNWTKIGSFPKFFNFDDMAIQPSGYSSIKKTAITTELNFYPNPSASGIFQFNEPELQTKPFQYQILDSAGKLIKIGNSNGDGTVDLSRQVKGQYIIEITQGEKHYTGLLNR